MQAAAYNHFAYNVLPDPWVVTPPLYVEYTPLASENIEVAVRAMMQKRLEFLVVPVYTETDGHSTLPRRFFACLLRDGLNINIVQVRMELSRGPPQQQQDFRNLLYVYSRQIRTPERVRQMYPQIDFTSTEVEERTIMERFWNPYLERCASLCDDLCLNDRTFIRSTLTILRDQAGWTAGQIGGVAAGQHAIALDQREVTIIDAVLGRTLNARFDQDLFPLALRSVLSAASFDAPARVQPKDLAMIIPFEKKHGYNRLDRFMVVVGVDTKVAKAAYVYIYSARDGSSIVTEDRLVISEEINIIAPGWQIQIDRPLTIMQLYHAAVGPMLAFHAAGLYSMYRLLYVPLLLPVAMAVTRKRWGGSVAPPPAIARLNNECMARIIQFALGRLH